MQNVRMHDVHAQTDTCPLHSGNLQSRTSAGDQQGQGPAAPVESPISQDRPIYRATPIRRRHRVRRMPGRCRSSGAMSEAQNSAGQR